jgi:tricorn protease
MANSPLRFPSISPDGQLIAFSALGDIWTYHIDNQSLNRITSHPAFDGYPVFSSDGKTIAFASDREGNLDIFTISVLGGKPEQLTFHTADDIPDCWNHQGIIFQSDRSNRSSLFLLKNNQLQSMQIPHQLFKGYWAIPHLADSLPDQSKILFNAAPESLWYYWRKGYRGPANSDIILFDSTTNEFSTLTDWHGNDNFPVFGHDQKTIYYVSDRNAQNIYQYSNGQHQPLTDFSDGYVRFLKAAANAPTLVFERNQKIWMFHTASRQCQELEIKLAADSPFSPRQSVELKDIDHYQISPDSKKIVVVSRGELFITDIVGNDFFRLTETPWVEEEPQWLPDSTNLIYICDQDEIKQIYQMDVLKPKQPKKIIAAAAENLSSIQISPDGNYLSYIEGKDQLKLYDFKTQSITLLYQGNLKFYWSTDYCWSPDSVWIVIGNVFYYQTDMLAVNIKNQQTLRLTDNASSESAYVFDPGGRYIYFCANYSGHDFPEQSGVTNIYQMEIGQKKECFQEDKFDALFAESNSDSPNKKNPLKKQSISRVEFYLKGLDHRISPLTFENINQLSPQISPDGSKLAYILDTYKDNQLWLSRLSSARKLKDPILIDSGSIGQVHWHKDKLYYINNSALHCYDSQKKINSKIKINERLVIDKNREYQQMFYHVWQYLSEFFYDKNYHQKNWKEIKEYYRPFFQHLQNANDFFLTIEDMLGELNSSHLGIYPPNTSKDQPVTAAIGADITPVENGLHIDQILPYGPLYWAKNNMTGWTLTHINHQSLQNHHPFRLLLDQVKKKVFLTFTKDGKNLTFPIKAISYKEEANLRLEQWRNQAQSRVKEWSKDTIGYIHMKDMSWEEWLRFQRYFDQYSVSKKALILDLRYNRGGNVHDQVLNTLIKQHYAKWQNRDYPMTNQPTYAFSEKPIVLLVNQHSLSDAEMTAAGFKALNLGKIIGTPTYGWLIFTSNLHLIDGSSFRLPTTGCYTLEGKNLENSLGVQPDIRIDQSFKDQITNKDPQLFFAVKELLNQITDLRNK